MHRVSLMHIHRLLSALLITACVSASSAAAATPDRTALLTVAEKSDFRATARHAEVVSVLDALAAASPLARRASMGTSAEGRDIPLIIMADPPVADAAQAREQVRASGKLLVLAIGNIHAGEVDGKEALPMLARQLLGLHDARTGETDLRGLLKHLVVVFAPIYNCDGNERVAKTNRPGQVGPDEGMGIRENAAGLDLNRDFIKVESPEGASLVRFMVEWDPHAFIDCHTTNGSLHRYVLTYAGPKMPAGDAELNRYARETFFPALSLMFDARNDGGKGRSFWYGSFEGAFGGPGPRGVNEHSRWETFPAEGRYGTNYFGLRNRLSVLSEAYAYATYKERVVATLDFVRCVLELAAENRKSISALLADADARAINTGNTVGEPNDTVAIRTRAAAWPGKVDILGYEEVEEGGRIKSTGKHKTFSVELWDKFEPALTVPRPWAYVIPHADAPEALVPAGAPGGAGTGEKAIPSEPAPAKDTGTVGVGGAEPREKLVPGPRSTLAIIDKLKQHGIVVEALAPGTELDATALVVTDIKQASRAYQGHVVASVDVKERAARVKLPQGGTLVRTGQPLGNLVCYLLEPACEDGLAAWNYLDPWLRADSELPVYRLMAPIVPK